MHNKINTAVRFEHPDAGLTIAAFGLCLQDQIPRSIIHFFTAEQLGPCP
jgi:hypothetical protein